MKVVAKSIAWLALVALAFLLGPRLALAQYSTLQIEVQKFKLKKDFDLEEKDSEVYFVFELWKDGQRLAQDKTPWKRVRKNDWQKGSIRYVTISPSVDYEDPVTLKIWVYDYDPQQNDELIDSFTENFAFDSMHIHQFRQGSERFGENGRYVIRLFAKE